MKTRQFAVAFVLTLCAGTALAQEKCDPPNVCEARNRQDGPRRQPDALDNFVAQLNLDADAVGVHVGVGGGGVGVHVGGAGVGVHTGPGGVGIGVGPGGAGVHVGVPDVDVDIDLNTPTVPQLPCTGTGCVDPPPRPRQPPGLPPGLPGQIEKELSTLSSDELALLLTVCDSVRKRPESYSAIKKAICELLAQARP